jgi:choline dehydrogenase-like flavoprotein
MTRFDTIVVGTGFASSFFLHEYLKHARSNERILVLERGERKDHAWQIEHRRSSAARESETFVGTGDPAKQWTFTIGFGGGSNCWWGGTPRMLPNDFRLRSLYGVGRDWPIGYGDLEPYYEEAEELMRISGPDDGAPFPRRRPYPLPPHRFTAVDRLLKQRFPDSFFVQPTARSSVATEQRPRCCANNVCTICPIGAKFTIANGLGAVYEDPRVTLRLQSEVLTVETEGGKASGVAYAGAHGVEAVGADLVVLGANGIFNPYILLKSGLHADAVGKGVTEQISIEATAYLDGVENFDGSTSITGHGYMLYDGMHRARNSGCLIETHNVPSFRTEPGRWRQVLPLRLIFEDLPDPRNFVSVSDDRRRPRVHFAGYHDYAYKGIEWAKTRLPQILEGLPVERVEFADRPNPTEAHVIGGTVMGRNPDDSVVDSDLIHHKVRNLVILGSGVFPSCAPANPTLTLSALALRSAARLLRSAAYGAR